MSTKRKKAEAELHSLYPVGRYPLFPDIRVWHDERMNTYYELTEMRVKVWANSIVGFLFSHQCVELKKCNVSGNRES